MFGIDSYEEPWFKAQNWGLVGVHLGDRDEVGGCIPHGQVLRYPLQSDDATVGVGADRSNQQRATF